MLRDFWDELKNWSVFESWQNWYLIRKYRLKFIANKCRIIFVQNWYRGRGEDCERRKSTDQNANCSKRQTMYAVCLFDLVWGAHKRPGRKKRRRLSSTMAATFCICTVRSPSFLSGCRLTHLAVGDEMCAYIGYSIGCITPRPIWLASPGALCRNGLCAQSTMNLGPNSFTNAYKINMKTRSMYVTYT